MNENAAIFRDYVRIFYKHKFLILIIIIIVMARMIIQKKKAQSPLIDND